ncbi:hypothetical protein D5085_07740 [Ectothiorhodospiraceae bacterium BW-2]|nr:hypothetical protein D5085_07740 [Ectothiorhodospiraceae bacterium BW-2]
MLIKHDFSSPLSLQDDHNRRMCDIAYRHLQGCHENYRSKVEHQWFQKVPSDSAEWGKCEFMQARKAFMFHESEEYTQALASILFSHIWIISVTNYYRLLCKGNKTRERVGCGQSLSGTDKIHSIAKQLELPQFVVDYAEELHRYRNTITHLVEGDKKTAPIANADFIVAYRYAKTAWVIFGALLRRYGMRPDLGGWRRWTASYGLPPSMGAAESVL